MPLTLKDTRFKWFYRPILFFFFWLYSLWDLSSLTRDGTQAPALEAQSPNL